MPDISRKTEAERARQNARVATLDILSKIQAERYRQIEDEGWTPEHDDKHEFGDLALAAAAYAAHSSRRGRQGDVMVGRINNWLRAGWFDLPGLLWPFDPGWWKPHSRERDLIRAGALIVAELERLARANNKDISENQDAQ